MRGRPRGTAAGWGMGSEREASGMPGCCDLAAQDGFRGGDVCTGLEGCAGSVAESCRACVLSSAALAACLGPVIGPRDVSAQRWGAGEGKLLGVAQASGWGARRDGFDMTMVLAP